MGVCGSRKKEKQHAEEAARVEADLKEAEAFNKKALKDAQNADKSALEGSGDEAEVKPKERKGRDIGSQGQIAEVLNAIKDKRGSLADAIKKNEDLLEELKQKRKGALEKLDTVNGKIDKMCLLRREYEKTQDACKGAYNKITDQQEDLLRSLKGQVEAQERDIYG